MSLNPAVIHGPSAAPSAQANEKVIAQGGGQSAAQVSGPSDIFTNPTNAGTPPPPSMTPVPGLTQAGSGGDEQDDCDEM
jgi:hypothetical protein